MKCKFFCMSCVNSKFKKKKQPVAKELVEYDTIYVKFNDRQN